MIGSNEVSKNAIIVRHYEPYDRAAIRTIALDTADLGKPVGSYFSFREPMADYLTRYYTDYEPQSAWVAEKAGEIIGYITGSVFPEKYKILTRLAINPVAGFKAVIGGALFRRQTWRLLKMAWIALRSRHSAPTPLFKEYPAHMHINIKSGFRGAGVGRQLVDTFLDHCRRSGIAGVHASVRADNESGRRFFEKMGFQFVFESSPLVLYYIDGSSKEFELVIYARKT